MILTGAAIADAVRAGDIAIEPFNASQLSPNSYDFRLGNRCVQYVEDVLDAGKENKTIEIIVPSEGIIAQPDRLYLFNTEEYIGSAKFVPIIRGRSSGGRLGIFIHITADIIDLGSYGQLTLQVHVVKPVLLYPRMLIGQITFWVPQGEIELYSGKYARAKRPTPSLAYKDFL